MSILVKFYLSNFLSLTLEVPWPAMSWSRFAHVFDLIFATFWQIQFLAHTLSIKTWPKPRRPGSPRAFSPSECACARASRPLRRYIRAHVQIWQAVPWSSGPFHRWTGHCPAKRWKTLASFVYSSYRCPRSVWSWPHAGRRRVMVDSGTRRTRPWRL